MNASKRIGWGIVGTGGMATQFAEALGKVEDANLLAVASRSRQKAEIFGQKFDIPDCHAPYAELLDNPAVDVVYIATPHSTHFEICLASLEKDKAVLCEKAFAINATQARKMIKLARSRKRFLMEAMWTRYVPAVMKLRELLQDEVIGDAQIMLAGGAYMPKVDADYYLLNKSLGGGILLDAGVYLVSMASMIFGKPEKILATGQLGQTGVDEHEAVLLTHQRGQIANLYVSHLARSAPDLTLMGSKGKIHLHPPIFCPSGLTLSVQGQEDLVFDYAGKGGYHLEAIEVNRCLREGRTESKLMPLDETLEVMETMDEIRRQIGMKYPADD